MPSSPKVVFLESQEGFESLFTRGLRAGAGAAGWKAELIFLSDASGQARPEQDVRDDLRERRPDAVCFLMDAPLSLKHLWDCPSLARVDKLSLWFDDYYRSPKTLAHPKTWTAWQQNNGVRVGMWDGYWRQQWKQWTGAEAFPIHLAADPGAFSSSTGPWKKEWSNRAVFIGTIPSKQSLDLSAAALPAPLARFLEEIVPALRRCPWPIRAYDTARRHLTFLSAKHRMAIEAPLREPRILAVWNHIVWRWGKRIARLRGLAAVAEAGPLAILSGHGTEHYADEADLRSALPRGGDWIYAETRSVPPRDWVALFHTGKFQVQITDPQSIQGGLPFRVFECGACGVPLLSDHRPELEALFPGSSGLALAGDESALSQAAARRFETSDADLAAQGRQFQESFANGHTWEIRWRQLMGNRRHDSLDVGSPITSVAPAA